MTSVKRRWAVLAATVVVAITAMALPSQGAAAPLTARLSKTTIALGASVDVTGTSNASPGARVYLQRHTSRGWGDVQSAVVSSTHTFKATIKPTGTGIYSLRIRSQSGGSVSATMFLRVTLQLADGTYELVGYEPCEVPVVGRLTVKGSTASIKVQTVTFTGTASRSGSAFSIAVKRADGKASIDLNGTVRPNALLTGTYEFGGIHDTGETGFTCAGDFDAYGPHVPGPSCALSVIKAVKLPTGYRWANGTPTCTGTWAAAYTLIPGQPEGGVAVLRWNGKAWTVYSLTGCSDALRRILPALIFVITCPYD